MTTAFPTTFIDLPSKGYYYSKESPLSSGKVELRYPTAVHEDILSSAAYIRQGIVIDRFISALLVDKNIKYSDFLAGDISQMMVAVRVLAYGSQYPVIITCAQCGAKNSINANLETLTDKNVPFPATASYENKFTFTLPISKQEVTFKLLTRKDLSDIKVEADAMAKINADVTHLGTITMKHSILSIAGDSTQETIYSAVDNMQIADIRALRTYYKSVDPDVEFKIDFTCSKCGASDREVFVLDETFFWPDSGI